ncbi:MAG: hypothetical protein M0C28_37040 [Candidatus Moduliflexus flocculans]|nr:hypothetical protein [Candidatus Moduliflexus flocculans]
MLLIEDVADMPDEYHLKPPYDAIPQLRSRSFIICPIVVRDQAVGRDLCRQEASAGHPCAIPMSIRSKLFCRPGGLVAGAHSPARRGRGPDPPARPYVRRVHAVTGSQHGSPDPLRCAMRSPRATRRPRKSPTGPG